MLELKSSPMIAIAAAIMIKTARLSYRTDSQTVTAIDKAASVFGGTVNLETSNKLWVSNSTV